MKERKRNERDLRVRTVQTVKPVASVDFSIAGIPRGLTARPLAIASRSIFINTGSAIVDVGAATPIGRDMTITNTTAAASGRPGRSTGGDNAQRQCRAARDTARCPAGEKPSWPLDSGVKFTVEVPGSRKGRCRRSAGRTFLRSPDGLEPEHELCFRLARRTAPLDEMGRRVQAGSTVRGSGSRRRDRRKSDQLNAYNVLLRDPGFFDRDLTRYLRHEGFFSADTGRYLEAARHVTLTLSPRRTDLAIPGLAAASCRDVMSLPIGVAAPQSTIASRVMKIDRSRLQEPARQSSRYFLRSKSRPPPLADGLDGPARASPDRFVFGSNPARRLERSGGSTAGSGRRRRTCWTKGAAACLPSKCTRPSHVSHAARKPILALTRRLRDSPCCRGSPIGP